MRIAKPVKIYEIAGYLRESTRLVNYSKTIFLINAGRDMFAVRKGYVVDMAHVNIQSGNNYLHYLSNHKLIHVTDIKVEIYQFSIDEAVHPPRISVCSTDSMEIPEKSDCYEYLDCIEVLWENFAIFYQLKPS